MPALDGNGPQGQGSMSGHKMGKCEGANPVAKCFGRGCRSGGMGRKMGRCYDVDVLTVKKEMLENKKAIIEARISALNKQDA